MDYSLQSIKDLLQQAFPITGAVSLDLPSSPLHSTKELKQNRSNSNSRPCISPQKLSKKRKLCNSASKPTNEGQWKTLRPLKHPSMIVGTIHLWNSTSHFRACSLNSDCLAFTDDTATICCVVLDLDPCVVGRQVQVLSWNFIPGKCGIGYLEINKWRLLNELSSGNSLQEFNFPSLCLSPAAARTRNYLLETPPCKERGRRSRTVLCGRLYSMSPPFVLPCSNSSNVSKNRKNKSLKDEANHIASVTADSRKTLFEQSDANDTNSGMPDCKKDLSRMHFEYGKTENCDGNLGVLSTGDDNRRKILAILSMEDDNGGDIADYSNHKLGVLSLDDDNKGKNSSYSNNKSRVLSMENDGREENMLGFLVELRVCNHTLNCGVGSKELLYRHVVGEKWHLCVTSAFVYFTGPVVAWRPVLSCLFGKCLSITGLKRKTMLAGEDKEEYNVFVATRTSVLTLMSSAYSSFGSSSHTSMALPARSVSDVRTLVPDLNTAEASVRSKAHISRHGKDGVLGSFSGTATPALMTINRSKQGWSRTGSYIGIVTGIHMQGALVELDRNAWLLLTHHLLTQVHGLRVGVLLALRHVHFIKIEIACEKILLLGACFKSHIVVKLFSPLRTPFIVRLQAQSLLSRYIESLPFTAAFWVLLVISCFRQKFRGIFCEKDILGSKNNEGIVQRYVHSRYPSFHSPHRDVLKEFFKHEYNCRMGEPTITRLQLIAPIINLCKQIEAMWWDHFSLIWTTGRSTFEEASMARGCHMQELGVNKVTNGDHFVRRIISSKELGVVLVGILQVSQQSGQLQLVDATGVLDAIVPDFLSKSALQNIYEVTDFNIVVEGYGGQLSLLETDGDIQQLSCASILHGVIFKSKPFSGTYYIHFYLKKAAQIDVPRWPPACADKLGHLKTGQKGGVFRIILVTHKYPINCKPCVDKTNQCVLSSFAEAVLLPYTIVNKGSKCIDHNRKPLKVKINDILEDGIFSDCKSKCSNEKLEMLRSTSTRQFICSKTRQRPDIDAGAHGNINMKCVSSEISTLLSCNGHGLQHLPSDTFYQEQNVSGNYFCKQFQLETPQEVPCSLLFRRLFKGDILLQGILFTSTSLEQPKMLLEGAGSKKILLEFDSESIDYYQLLQIGGCYLIQYEAEVRSSDRSMAVNHMKADKILVTSQNPIWSLAFSYHQIAHQNEHKLSASCGPCLYDSPSLILQLHDINEPHCSNSVENERSVHDWHGQSSSVHFRDAILYLPHEAMGLLQMFIKQVKAYTIPAPMDVCDAVDKFLVSWPLKDALQPFSEAMVSHNVTASRGRLPEGELISLHGEVKDVCFKGLGSFAKQNRLSCKCLSTDPISMFLQKVTYTILIQDCHRAQKIRLYGTLNGCMLPLGLGPGVIASFYRILSQSGPNGVQEFMATSASLIVINAIKDVHYHSNDGFDIEVGNQMQSSNYWHIKDSVLISCLSQSLNEDCLILRCRVVAVQSLVLEWQPGKCKLASQSVGGSRDALHSIGIISASFILDDGSGLCDCWASGERAAYLLGIHSTAVENFKHIASTCKISERGTKKKLMNTVGCLLPKLVKKHRRVIVQNSKMAESQLHAELVINGSSKEILNPEEKRLISFVLARACDIAPLMIVGSILSSVDPQTGGESKCDEVEIMMDQENFSTLTQCRMRILARYVASVNYLQETGNIFQELGSEI